MTRVRYLCPFGQSSGYAQACQDYLMALLSAGVELDIEPIPNTWDDENIGERYSALKELIGTSNYPTHFVIHANPQYCHEFAFDEFSPDPEVPRIANTTWETSKVPANIALTINRTFDAIIVPSQFVDEALQAGGISRDKTHVIPHCFDPDWWLRPLPGRGDQPYTFYTIINWCERKNPIGLLKAYWTAFAPTDNVLLKIICPGYSLDDVQMLYTASKFEQTTPAIQLIDARLSDQDLWNLHATSDCYITLSRGEGFGLGSFEAAVMGNPVIATEFSGHTEYLANYLHKHYVPCYMTPVVTPEPKTTEPVIFAGELIAPVEGHQHALCADQDWAEPSLLVAKTLMQKAYKERWDKWPVAAKRIHELYNYEVIGAQFRRVLEGI